MKFFIKRGILGFFALLIVANIYIFISGIALSDEISHFENEVKRLKTENAQLETKVYDAASLSHAASLAAELNFTKKSTPLYIDNIAVALNR